MVVTKEHQEQLTENYRKKGRNEFEIMGFVDGMNEMFNYINKGLNNDMQNKVKNK